MADKDFLRVLRTLDIFKGLPDRGLQVLFESMREVHLAPGKVLFEEGSPADSLYVVWTGRVEVFKMVGDRGEERLATLGLGACLGEMGLIRQSYRSATVRAMDDTILLELENERLTRLADQEPQVWGAVMRNLAIVLAARLETMDERVIRQVVKEGPNAGKGLLARILGL